MSETVSCSERVRRGKQAEKIVEECSLAYEMNIAGVACTTCIAAALDAEAKARAELEKAAKTVFEGFEAGMFVRDVHHDDDPAWAIRLVPYIRALAVLAQDGESGAESVNPGIVQKS